MDLKQKILVGDGGTERSRSHGKTLFSRSLQDEISAAWVRESVIRQFHGEFAYLNYPPERRKRNKPVRIERRAA